MTYNLARVAIMVALSAVMTTGIASAQSVGDAGFEVPLQPGTTGFDAFEQASGTGNGTLAGSAWMFTAGAGISRNFSAFQNAGVPAPEGQQHAIMQNVGTITQAGSGFVPGEVYSITVAANSRQAGQANNLQIFVDGNQLMDGRITNNGFRDVTSVNFVAGSATPSIQFATTNPLGGDQTTFIDNVRINSLGVVSTPTLSNPNFEAGPSHSGVGYGAISGWTTNTQASGLNSAGGPFLNGLAAPEGASVGFIQRSGAGITEISQNITGLTPGKAYTIKYLENERGSGAVIARPSATVDGNVIVAEHDAVRTGAFRRVVSQAFTATDSTAVLALRTNIGTGDNTALFDNVQITRAIPLIADGGFENPVQPGTTGFDAFEQANGTGNGTLAGSAWTFSGGAGISRNTSAFQNSGVQAPEGQQIAIFQGINNGATQTISGFEFGAEYNLLFEAAARVAGGGNDLEIILDLGLASEQTIFDIDEIVNPAFQEFASDPFIAAKDSYTLTLQTTLNGGALSGDRTTFVDDLRFNFLAEPVPEPASIALWAIIAVVLGAGYYTRRSKKAA